MQRKFEQPEEDLPPGFTHRRLTRRLPEFQVSSPNMSCESSKDKGKRNRAIPSDGEVIKSPNTKLDSNPAPVTKKTKTMNPETQTVSPENGSEVSQKTKTHHDMPKNPNDKGTITTADILSFHGENGEVYTLSGPPKAPDLTRVRTPQVDAASIVCVKEGLISFINKAGPNKVGHIITQANNTFASLEAMNADYGSFYNSIRKYIGHCLDWYAAERELKRCEASEKLVSRYDKLLRHSSEMKKEVSVVERDIEKAKVYMAPLEARLQDMKDMVEKLEIELEERRNDLRNLEEMKAEKMEEIAATDVELKHTAPVVESTRPLIEDNFLRQLTAKMLMELARSWLKNI